MLGESLGVTILAYPISYIIILYFNKNHKPLLSKKYIAVSFILSWIMTSFSYYPVIISEKINPLINIILGFLPSIIIILLFNKYFGGEYYNESSTENGRQKMEDNN